MNIQHFSDSPSVSAAVVVTTWAVTYLVRTLWVPARRRRRPRASTTGTMRVREIKR